MNFDEVVSGIIRRATSLFIVLLRHQNTLLSLLTFLGTFATPATFHFRSLAGVISFFFLIVTNFAAAGDPSKSLTYALDTNAPAGTTIDATNGVFTCPEFFCEGTLTGGVFLPVVFPVNIVDLGLVYECDVSKNDDATRTVDIKMTLTAPGCGMGEVLVQDVRDKVQIVPTVARANVELVFDPPWNQTMMSDEARLQTGMM